ncbi:oxidoreductase, partial [Campylobacter jejuni]
MAKLSNEELKDILIKRIEKIENSDLVDKKTINEESVKALAKHLSLGNEIPALAQRFFQIAPKTKLVWLHLCECTGCSESLLRSELPSFDELIFDFFSLEYHETLMAANGTKAEELLEHVLKEDFVLAVEGGVAAIDTFFLTIGAEGESGYAILE